MRGIITVLNTPYTKGGGVDLKGLRRNVSSAVDAGVTGFLVPAMASEVSHLSQTEKCQIVEQVVTEVAGRVPVIGGASAETEAARIDIARQLIGLGCEGILVPVVAAADPYQIERELAEIAALQPDFIMVQDWDADGAGLEIDTVLWLFERIEPFRWLKIEVVDAGPKYTEVLKRTNGKLQVAGGWAVTEMIDGLDRGVNAFMPTAMHRIYVQIHRMHSNGDRQSAIDLFDRIRPVLKFSNQDLNTSIRFFKQMLHAQGVFETDQIRVDRPLWTVRQERIAKGLIGRVTAIESSLSEFDSVIPLPE